MAVLRRIVSVKISNLFVPSILTRERLIMRANFNYSYNDQVQHCYTVLGLSEQCSDVELRESYLSLVKDFHPDSSSQQADGNKFNQIDNAYRTLLNHRQKIKQSNATMSSSLDGEDDEEESRFDIKHTAPQHRQYLEHEGIGFGTPSVRQKQYQLYQVQKAAENVTEYQVQKISSKYESAVVVKDRKRAQKVKIRNAIERLVEDLISSSMAKGEFDNLPGNGKPLKENNFNPMVDSTTQNINKIMIEHGYVPNWILLEKEIKQNITEARKALLKARIFCGREPIPPQSKVVWDNAVANFGDRIKETNSKINNFNLQVPGLWQQLMHYNTDKEVMKVLSTYKEKLEKGECYVTNTDLHNSGINGVYSNSLHKHGNSSDNYKMTISFKDVIKEIKALFSS